MVLESLLLSCDPQVIGVLRPALEELSIAVDECSDADAGAKILAQEKFDAVIVDCDDLEGGLVVLESLRKGSSNRSSVMFAILNGETDTQTAFELGANFVLQKPISALNAMRCFSAALGLMERERRRYFRHPLEVEVQIVVGDDQTLKVASTNLSEGGIAVKFSSDPPRGVISKVIFTLPGMATPIETVTEVAWLDGSGRMGLRFKAMSNPARELLENWLEDQMENSERVPRA